MLNDIARRHGRPNVEKQTRTTEVQFYRNAALNVVQLLVLIRSCPALTLPEA